MRNLKNQTHTDWASALGRPRAGEREEGQLLQGILKSGRTVELDSKGYLSYHRAVGREITGSRKSNSNNRKPQKTKISKILPRSIVSFPLPLWCISDMYTVATTLHS